MKQKPRTEISRMAINTINIFLGYRKKNPTQYYIVNYQLLITIINFQLNLKSDYTASERIFND